VEYFEEHLAVGDYDDEVQPVSGEWIGLGAERPELARVSQFGGDFWISMGASF